MWLNPLLNLTQVLTEIHRSAPWLLPMLGGTLGAVAGSFTTCALHRVPNHISLRQPPSHCPHCHTVLGIPDLVPLLSWVALRGRCRHCRAPIPARSLLVEAIFTAVGVGSFYIIGPTAWLFGGTTLILGGTVGLVLLGQQMLMRFSHTR